MGEKWIQDTDLSGVSIKSDRYLGIPSDTKIPKTLLRRIINAPVGSTITNPTKTGNRRIKVTQKLKSKAIFVWNANYGGEP